MIVDGLMQGFDLGAYGWIPRFATGKRISYVLGDASHAYNGMFPKYGITSRTSRWNRVSPTWACRSRARTASANQASRDSAAT